MRNRLPRIVILAMGVCALASPPAQGYIATSRMSSTATNPSTGTQGTPITMTWSIVPDGTSIPGASSNLLNFLDATYGAGPGGANLTQRPWFTLLDQSFSRLSAVSGVTYVYEPHDDGLTTPTPLSSAPSAAGLLGVRGDERLSGKVFGNNTLAATFFPDFSDMMVGTDQGPFLSVADNNYRRLRNVMMHESMHALGVSHVESIDAAFLMRPVILTNADGPQLDDILALQRLYGDALEKNGGNDAANNATPLGSLGVGGSLNKGTLGDSTVVAGSDVGFLSIDDNSDLDYFSFTVTATLDITLGVTPKGATYQAGPTLASQSTFNAKALSDLSLALFDSSGVQQLGATANANGLGFGETISRQLTAGTYYARVSGATDDVQLYQISLSGFTVGPQNLTWTGSAGGTWDVGASANFNNGNSSVVFHAGDSVTFADGAMTTNVLVLQQVSPAAMHINATSNYKFSGPAGIVVSDLVIEGGGAVEFLNSANAFSGVDLRAGSLKIAGSGNSPLDGSIRVASGASLQVDGTQTWATTSKLTGSGQVSAAFLTMPGAIAPGDAAGTLTVAGNLILVNSSGLAIELGGIVAGSGYDVLHVTGIALVDGTFNVSLFGGFQPADGASFSVITAGQLVGAFDSITLPSLAPGLMWQTQYTATDFVLSISSTVTYNAADFNQDGFVNAADLAAWQAGFGILSGATHGQGDANGDAVVDAADFMIWQQNLNAGGGATATSGAVPEPTAWAMFAAAAATTLGPLRRRTRR